jgi:hypothetical protein
MEGAAHEANLETSFKSFFWPELGPRFSFKKGTSPKCQIIRAYPAGKATI